MRRWGIGYFFLFFTGQLAAQSNTISKLDSTWPSLSVKQMPEVQVLVQRNKLLSTVPGSVSIMSPLEIKHIAPLSGNEVLRKIPGLNIVDEEGIGLRVNIGIRGLDPDRSRNILILEDGIPVALNPYGEPEMYFTPSIDKVNSVEVLKGSGQILFGPQTIGGVINYITASPPVNESKRIKVLTGSGGYLSSFVSYGNTVGKAGFIVNYLHKRASNFGATDFNLHDLSAKFKFELNEKSRIAIKLGVYDEMSNATYIGLTQTMYTRKDNDFVRMAPYDRLPVKRMNLSATHQYNLNNQLVFQTTVFGYQVTRNWRRQDFSSSPLSMNKSGVVWGTVEVPNGAVYMLNSNGHRNRQFSVGGIESQFTWTSSLQQLKFGLRGLSEKAEEQFLIGNKADAIGGNLRDVEIRKGNAISVYVQDKITVSDQFSFNIGLRLEDLHYSRNILRGRFLINNNVVTADTNLLKGNNIVAWIPGFGFNYTLGERITFFGGIHKGFAPPRTKDAITANGFALDLANEESWNTELGVRTNIDNFFEAELTFFKMDFTNQIIPISQSSGNVNTTGLANGGRTRHSGIELGISYDFAKAIAKSYTFKITTNATFVESKYAEDRFMQVGLNTQNIKGYHLPYAPRYIVNNAIEYISTKGNGIRISGNFVDDQFTDELNTLLPTANGLTGRIDQRYLTDLTFFYKLPQKNINLTFAIKNLTDERYIASRRPQGIRVGLERQVFFGLELNW